MTRKLMNERSARLSPLAKGKGKAKGIGARRTCKPQPKGGNGRGPRRGCGGRGSGAVACCAPRDSQPDFNFLLWLRVQQGHLDLCRRP